MSSQSLTPSLPFPLLRFVCFGHGTNNQWMGGWQANLRLGEPEGEGSKSKEGYDVARSGEGGGLE